MRFWIAAVFVCSLSAQVASRPSLAEPAISPDHKEIAFVSGGDIWSVPATGGEARLLVSHPANDSLPRWSPDGKELAFLSTRTGNGDIYVLTLATGALRRITFDDGPESLNGWSADGKYLYFHSNARDISGMNDIYRVGAQGGTPMQVSADLYASEFFSAGSPKGDAIAFSARGNAAGQWWRAGRSHLDRAEIWMRRDNGDYQRVSGGEYRELWPMWSADGQFLYFVSDRSGSENLWEAPVMGRRAPRAITQFKEGRVMWPTISADGKMIVFERDFRIWKYDLAGGKSEQVEITLRGAPAGPSVQRMTLNSNFGEMALSPDGRKIAFTGMGEIWAASARDGGNAFRVTRSAAAETRPVWSPDSKKIVYVSSRDGFYSLYQYDFTAEKETRLTNDAAGDHSPMWSPDGKFLAFIRGREELRVWDAAANQDRLLTKGYFARPPQGGQAYAWSPDSQWVGYFNSGPRGYRNVFAIPVAGGTPQQLSFLPNSFAGNLTWHPESTRIFFNTAQRTETNYIARVDLIPMTPKFREDQFRDLFKDQPRTEPAKPGAPARPAPKPVKIVAADIRDRLTLLRTGLDVGQFSVSPDGKTLLIAGEAAVNLYTFSIDELSREAPVARQLTSTPGQKGNAQWSPDGREVYFMEGGRVQIVNTETRQVRPLNITADIEMDFDEVKRQVFAQAWTYMNDNFYDPAMHGTDWKTQRERFAPLVEGSRTPDELRRVLSLMIGTLNASHTGISAPFGPPSPNLQVGKLGVRFDRAEYEANGKFKISHVIALSPAAIQDIKPGAYLLAVEGTPLEAKTNLESLFEGKVGRRVTLTIADDASGAGNRDVVLQPVSTGAEKDLLYREWVKSRREYVSKVSGGRLGYVHMPDMSENSLQRLYTDLDTENQSRDGVVIDIRNNNGGFVNAYALDVFARKPYLQMQSRGLPAPNPARSQLGQRSLEKPTILVTNQHSLSDAEDFTEGYRALKLGKVVGEKTAGWIIYTGGAQLIDGSQLRLPSTRVTTLGGENMELNPRPVDVAIERPIGESYSGKDVQLDAAVKELLNEIGSSRRSAGSQ